MIAIWVHLMVAASKASDLWSEAVAARAAGERGQASAEYALVLLGAAAVALLVVSWATKSDMVGRLLNKVFTTVSGKVS